MTKRLVCNLKVQEIADICGVSRQTIGNIEHGRLVSGPSITLVGLALDMIAEENGLTKVFEALEK